MFIDFLCVLVYLYLFYILLIFVVNQFPYIVRDIEVLCPCLQTGKKVLRRCVHKKALVFFCVCQVYISLCYIYFRRFSYMSTYFLYFPRYLFLFYILSLFLNIFLYIVKYIDEPRPCPQTGQMLRRCAHKKV